MLKKTIKRRISIAAFISRLDLSRITDSQRKIKK